MRYLWQAETFKHGLICDIKMEKVLYLWQIIWNKFQIELYALINAKAALMQVLLTSQTLIISLVSKTEFSS